MNYQYCIVFSIHLGVLQPHTEGCSHLARHYMKFLTSNSMFLPIAANKSHFLKANIRQSKTLQIRGLWRLDVPITHIMVPICRRLQPGYYWLTIGGQGIKWQIQCRSSFRNGHCLEAPTGANYKTKSVCFPPMRKSNWLSSVKSLVSHRNTKEKQMSMEKEVRRGFVWKPWHRPDLWFYPIYLSSACTRKEKNEDLTRWRGWGENIFVKFPLGDYL